MVTAVDDTGGSAVFVHVWGAVDVGDAVTVLCDFNTDGKVRVERGQRGTVTGIHAMGYAKVNFSDIDKPQWVCFHHFLRLGRPPTA
eukprot:gene30906-16237_t